MWEDGCGRMLLGGCCGVVVVVGTGTGRLRGCLDNQTPTSTSQVPCWGCVCTAHDRWDSPSSHPALRGLSTPSPEQWGSCGSLWPEGRKAAQLFGDGSDCRCKGVPGLAL